jgi:hypothetical protein
MSLFPVNSPILVKKIQHLWATPQRLAPGLLYSWRSAEPDFKHEFFVSQCGPGVGSQLPEVCRYGAGRFMLNKRAGIAGVDFSPFLRRRREAEIRQAGECGPRQAGDRGRVGDSPAVGPISPNVALGQAEVCQHLSGQLAEPVLTSALRGVADKSRRRAGSQWVASSARHASKRSARPSRVRYSVSSCGTEPWLSFRSAAFSSCSRMLPT